MIKQVKVESVELCQWLYDDEVQKVEVGQG